MESGLVHKYHQLRGTERVDVQLSPNMCTLCSSKVLKMFAICLYN